MKTKKQGDLLNFEGSAPLGKPQEKKTVSKEISNMIHSLSELPSGHLPNKK